METKLLVIVRIYGRTGIYYKLEDTFHILKLYKKYHTVVIPNTKPYLGMITKLKDFITWGELNEETLKLLIKKRGRLPSKKPLTEEYIKEKLNTTIDQFAKEVFSGKKQLKDLPGFKPFFKLSPPKGGFEKRGTKQPYSMGGALGYRKDKINDLIKRMI